MVKGALFDLDGTLISSAQAWLNAEAEVFRREGVELSLEDQLETHGLKSIESVTYHYPKIKSPKRSAIELNADVETTVLNEFGKSVNLKDGIIELLHLLQKENIPMAIASASSFRFIKTAAEKFGIDAFFKFLYSSDFEKHGKPHPGIYITAAQKLGVDPLKALAFEDSFFGILAAKAARIKTIAIIDNGQINNTKFDFADMKIESFHNFGRTELEYFNNLI